MLSGIISGILAGYIASKIQKGEGSGCCVTLIAIITICGAIALLSA